MGDEAVKVKFATVSGPTVNEEDPHASTVRLSMRTEDDVDVNFDLNIIAIALLMLTAQPCVQALKAVTGEGVK